MRAIVCTRYGPPEILKLQEVEKPTPKDDEALIEVHASSINSWDWELLSGRAQFTLGGRLKPRYEILGCDIAGRVKAVGRNVKNVLPGDEVFGDISGSGWGGFAEFVCAKEKALAQKSARMSFEQAAATPQAAVLALQSLRNKGKIQAGQSVLINGAGGGVGTFAVQIAKSYGAYVTGVDSSEKLDMILDIGADHVVDYAKQDFTRSGQRYDIVVDVVARHSVFEYKRALRPGGKYVIIGGSAGAALQALLLGSWILGNKKASLLLLKPNPADLAFIRQLFEAGKVVPVIDRCYPLEEVPEAFRYYAQGHVKGKIVVKVR